MQPKYDCTADVIEHKLKVFRFMSDFTRELDRRSLVHDNSKLESPEKETFDEWTPELKARTFGTDYYKQALDGMGEGLKHHYAVNTHHPEHYPNGIDGMNLHDLVEMVCDWQAAAQVRGVRVDVDHAVTRFGLSPQLESIIRNSIQED